MRSWTCSGKGILNLTHNSGHYVFGFSSMMFDVIMLIYLDLSSYHIPLLLCATTSHSALQSWDIWSSWLHFHLAASQLPLFFAESPSIQDLYTIWKRSLDICSHTSSILAIATIALFFPNLRTMLRYFIFLEYFIRECAAVTSMNLSMEGGWERTGQ